MLWNFEIFTFLQKEHSFLNLLIPLPDHKGIDYQMVSLLPETSACYKGIDEIIIHSTLRFFWIAYQTVCILIHQRLFNHFDIGECNRRSQQTLYIFLTAIYHMCMYHNKFYHIYTIREPNKPCIFSSLFISISHFLPQSNGELTTRVIKDTHMFFYFLLRFILYFHTY